MNSGVFDAVTLLNEAVISNKIDFATLVAETSLWASTDVVKLLLDKKGSPEWFPNTRRGRLAQGEIKGKEVN